MGTGVDDNGNIVSSTLSTLTLGDGNAGDLIITTKRLILQDGAGISTSSIPTVMNPNSKGQSGNLTINASEFVEIIGLSASVGRTELTVGTDTIGNAGNLEINTANLFIRDGAQISADTTSLGQGGTLTITAVESVEIEGIGIDSNGQVLPSTLVAASTDLGNSGNLNIETNQLIIRDNAEVSVSATGEGIAGNLEVKVSSIELDNQGQFTAETASGDGGNIELWTEELLLLHRNSHISTTAFGNVGNGGNIDIQTNNLIALENSNIVSNAFQGQGGNIQITTQGLFLSSNSQIKASSELGIDGVVEINRPGVDPSNSLVQLSVEILDIGNLVIQDCEDIGNLAAGEFTLTGRGGLPTNPEEIVTIYTVLSDLGKLSNGISGQNHDHLINSQYISESNLQKTNATSELIIEAQGWEINTKGKVVLTAKINAVTPYHPWLNPTSCHD